MEDELMSISLQKRGTISLKKEDGMRKCMVGLGWDPVKEGKGIFGIFGGGEHDIDCDAAVMLVYGNGETELISFMKKNSDTGCVRHMGDNLTGEGEGDDEQIFLDLERMPSNIVKIVVGVNIYQARSRHQHFGKIENCFVRLVNNDNNVEFCRYDISRDSSYDGCTSMIMGMFEREYTGYFKFTAIGEPSMADSVKSMFNGYCGV